MQDWLAKLIALIGDGNVGFLHKILTSPPNSLRDGFGNATKSGRNVGEDQYVKEPESASDDIAFSKRVLGSIAALLDNVLDARGGAVMVVVKSMQRSEVKQN